MTTPPIQFTEMELRQRKFLEERARDMALESPDTVPLVEKLLSITGRFALVPKVEDDLNALLDRGSILGGTATDREFSLKAGEPGQCHTNAALGWRSAPGEYTIATGYGLSEDGIWRQHSWLMRGECVVETTVSRLLYYGFELTESEAEVFCEEQWAW